MHTACVRKGVCARVRARVEAGLGPLAVELNSLQVPSARGGMGSKFFPALGAPGRTNECPPSHALWVYPAGKERGLQRVPPGARSLQYPARLQGAGSVSSLPALEQGCLAAAPPLHAGARL